MIVQACQNSLEKTTLGHHLLQLFARLELATYRHVSVYRESAPPFDRWRGLTYSLQTPIVQELENGDVDFEVAWIGLMKILGNLMELRIDSRVGPDTTLGSFELFAKGEILRRMLGVWGTNLPTSFLPIQCPDVVKNLGGTARTDNEIDPIFYRSFQIAVAMGAQSLVFVLTVAHHSALEVVIAAHTESPGPTREHLYTAAWRTFQICRGVQLMRDAGVIQVPDGLDFGIIWPLLQAANLAKTSGIREWILDLFNNWPVELILVRASFESLLVDVSGSGVRTTQFVSYMGTIR
jgi:hypothetical protein